jgi:hypothetical protein
MSSSDTRPQGKARSPKTPRAEEQAARTIAEQVQVVKEARAVRLAGNTRMVGYPRQGRKGIAIGPGLPRAVLELRDALRPSRSATSGPLPTTIAPKAEVVAPDRLGEASLSGVVLARSDRALAEIVSLLDTKRLAQLAQLPSDVDLLFALLQTPEAVACFAERNPVAAAILRGNARKRELLSAEGGAISAVELSTLLGITPQAIGKRRDRDQIFWLPAGEGYVYPLFQLQDDVLLAGVPAVLKAFRDDNPWFRVSFMLSGDRRLGGERPIDVLRKGDVQAVVRAVEGYGEHGA